MVTNGQTIKWVLVAALVGFSSAAHASTFNVNPIQLHLSSEGRSALLTVRNTSQEELRFQVKMFAWDQSNEGEIQLKPTRDIIFFPRMMKLAPGEERKVRVGLAREAEARRQKEAGKNLPERTYRILVEELPSRRTKKDKNQLNILTRMSIPIFVAPDGGFEKPTITKAKTTGERFTFNLENTGTVHTMVRKLSVSAIGSKGQPLFVRDMPSWYVLAGGTRAYDVEVPSALCDQVRALKVDGQTANEAVSFEFKVPSGACSPR